MPAPQALLDMLNSIQVLGAPGRLNSGDKAKLQLSPDPMKGFDFLAEAQKLADIDLNVNLDDISLDLSPLPTGDATFEIVLKGVEFSKPVETTAANIQTNAQAVNELPYLVPNVGTGNIIQLGAGTKVEGLLGKLKGTINQAQGVVGSIVGTITGALSRTLLSAAPTIALGWWIEDENANRLKAGDHFAFTAPAINPASSVTPELVFFPEFAEFSLGSDPLVQRRVFCKIDVTFLKPPPNPGNMTETASRTIGPIMIHVPVLQVPTVAAMTLHAVTDPSSPGAILLAVPSGSVIDGPQKLSAALKPVQSSLKNLTVVAGAVFGEASAIVDRLVGLLNPTAFVRKDREDDLHNVQREPGGFLGFGYKSFEDCIAL